MWTVFSIPLTKSVFIVAFWKETSKFYVQLLNIVSLCVVDRLVEVENGESQQANTELYVTYFIY